MIALLLSMGEIVCSKLLSKLPQKFLSRLLLVVVLFRLMRPKKFSALGADKITINSGAIKNKYLISDLANKFGSQAIVVEIQAQKNGDNTWEALYENGREHSGLDAVEWAKEAEELGAGEILLTSVDFEGTALGFESNLARQVMSIVSVPVIISGGMGKLEHLSELFQVTDVNAVSCAHVLHYDELTISEIKSFLLSIGKDVRQ